MGPDSAPAVPSFVSHKALVGACSSRSDANVTVSTKLLEALQAAGMAGCGLM